MLKFFEAIALWFLHEGEFTTTEQMLKVNHVQKRCLLQTSLFKIVSGADFSATILIFRVAAETFMGDSAYRLIAHCSIGDYVMELEK